MGKQKALKGKKVEENYFSSIPNPNKIFKNFINNKLKKIPLNIKKNDQGKIKYLPPVSKEWKNTIYSFYKDKMKNIPINSININKIIRFYFDLYFFNNEMVKSKYIFLRKRRYFLKKIHISQTYIKHTNNKAIITIYTVNLEKNKLYKKYQKKITRFTNKIFQFLKYELNIKVFETNFIENFISKNYFLIKRKEFIKLKYKFLSQFVKKFIDWIKSELDKKSETSLWREKLILLKKHQYIYYLNKYKFEKKFFLYKLSVLLSKILNKQIEYNIINLKSFSYNTDIFTNVLSLKLKKRRNKMSVMRGINSILNRAKLPIVNRIIEKGNLTKYKSVDFNLLENRYKDINLISILSKYSLNKFLKKLYYDNLFSIKKDKPLNKKFKKDNSKISNSIFNSINYKNMGGIRLEVKGRLTRRYRADRAIYKLKWKGGLKNIDSSFKGLSSVLFRGYLHPNVNYSISNSKRRIGAFSVKGWVSGK